MIAKKNWLLEPTPCDWLRSKKHMLAPFEGPVLALAWPMPNEQRSRGSGHVMKIPSHTCGRRASQNNASPPHFEKPRA